MGTPRASDSFDLPARERPPVPAAREQRLRRGERVRDSNAFRMVLHDGARAGDDLLRVWAADNGLPRVRLGLLITKRHGNAVRRNRLKRLIREAFRSAKSELPTGLDLLCGPHVGVRLTLRTCRASLIRLAQLAAKRLRN